jgi:hypothetical protein
LLNSSFLMFKSLECSTIAPSTFKGLHMQYQYVLNNITTAFSYAWELAKNETSTAYNGETGVAIRNGLYNFGITILNGIVDGLTWLLQTEGAQRAYSSSISILSTLQSNLRFVVEQVNAMWNLLVAAKTQGIQVPSVVMPQTKDEALKVAQDGLKIAAEYAKTNWVAVTVGTAASVYFGRNFANLLSLHNQMNAARQANGLEKQSLFALSNLTTTTFALGLQFTVVATTAMATFAPVAEVSPIIAVYAGFAAHIAYKYSRQALEKEVEQLRDRSASYNLLQGMHSQGQRDVRSLTASLRTESRNRELAQAAQMQAKGIIRDGMQALQVLNGHLSGERATHAATREELGAARNDITALTRTVEILGALNTFLRTNNGGVPQASTTSMSASSSGVAAALNDNELVVVARFVNLATPHTTSVPRPLDDMYTRLFKDQLAAEENRRRAETGQPLMIA